VANPDQGKQY